MTSVRAALQTARATLACSDTADLDAQVLLAHVLQVERAFLFAHGEYLLDTVQRRMFQSFLERRAAGEPIAYILGAKGFYDLDLIVTPAVLIPRPETELLLEEALRLTEQTPEANTADIGTGSGALAVTYALQRPQSKVYASDVSEEALDVARNNAAHQSAKVSFYRGNLAAPLLERRIKVDLLMANLPYIASEALDQLPVSRWEPRLALDGGADGLALIRELLTQAPSVCRSGANVLLEFGADQADAVSQLIRDCLLTDCTVLQDYAGLDRIVHFQI